MIRSASPGTLARCATAWLVLLLPAMIVLTSGVASAQPLINEFLTPPPGSAPVTVTAGPDGNVWFTEFISHQVGRITPGGTITEFVPPTPFSGPWGIATGPDGNLWFTEYNGNTVVRLTPDGSTFTEFPIPTAGSQPRGIITGPDGNLWFCEAVGNQIGRI